MSKKKTVILALLVMFLWGSLFPMVKLGYQAYQISTSGDILLFAGIRFTICGGIICLFSLIKDRKNYIPVKSSILPILLSGLLAIVLHYAFTYIGLRYIESSKTAILKQVGTLFYVIFSALFFKGDKLTLKKFIGVILGFVGIIVINISDEVISIHIGDILILLASFCTVFSNIITKKVVQKVEPITATGCSQLFGGIVLLSVGLAMGGSVQMVFDWSILIMVYICVASIFGYCIWYSISKTEDLSNLSIIKFAEPLFSCILGAVILKEDIFRMQYLIGLLLIVFGVVISQYRKTKRVDEKEERTKGR